MKDRILKLLSSGLPQAVVASSVGCTASYISQLMADKEFANAVAMARTTGLSAALDRDEKLDKLEDLVLDKMEQSLPYVTKPMELTRIYQTLNVAKRRAVPATGDLAATQQVISLTIPIQVVASFQLSQNKEIVEVDGRTLVSLSAKQLQEQLSQRNKYANNLPAPAARTDRSAATDSIESKIT